MRSTLFFIPHELFGIPLFGVGWALGLLIVAGLGWLIWQVRSGYGLSAIASAGWFWVMAALLITFVLSAVEQSWPDGTPIGLPVRGYGLMVLLGLISGIGLTNIRARQLGVNTDQVVGLGIWAMLGGVLGARIFYVVQKWDTFSSQGIQRLIDIVKLTEGGLVIYGGMVGGLLAGGYYCYRHRLNLLATGDLIVPGFLIGLAFGRIGCLLHGCCYGGICLTHLPAIQFPQGSLPYMAQIDRGQILGLDLSSERFPQIVRSLRPGSPAELAGIRVGDELRAIYPHVLEPVVGSDPAASPPVAVELLMDKGRTWIAPSDLPTKTLRMHPSQIYASVNAVLLCLLMWSLQPFFHRDGMVLCSGLVLYATSRFLLEWIRSDEPGQLGTQLTIAQIIALLSGLIAAVGFVVLYRRPPHRLWDWSNS